MNLKCTITRKIEFDAGHRVYQHESKCNSIHGHRYVIEVTISGEKLDGLGRIIDFSVVKHEIGGWIDEKIDHAMIIYDQDPLCGLWDLMDADSIRYGRQKKFIVDFNPTAENLSIFFYNKFNQLLNGSGLRITHIKLFETPNCWAEYTE